MASRAVHKNFKPPPTTSSKEVDVVPPEAPPISTKPPPERIEAIQTRRLVILSFWIIIILFGLPVWLWTTSIHRAVLPLDQMAEWADGMACKPTFPLKAVIQAPGLPEKEVQGVIQNTQQALNELNQFSAHRLELTLDKALGLNGKVDPQDVALYLRLNQRDGVQEVQAELRPQSSVLDVFYASNHAPLGSGPSALTTAVAIKLHQLFAEEQAAIASILVSHKDSSVGLPPDLSAEFSSRLARRATRALKYSPMYHITISLITPIGTPTSWDIEAAINQDLRPLLDSYSISNFSVDTQVQLYSTFSPSAQQPQHDPETGTWTLRTEELGSFINAAEWPLGPSIGEGPTLNFILYVPDPAQSPLLVKETSAASWLIPQWGGVFVLNPTSPSSSPHHLSSSTLSPALLTFAHQLLNLLGTTSPSAPISFQISSLTRVHAAATLRSAASTLGSLAALTRSLANIPIPEEVAARVTGSMEHLHSACGALQNGAFAKALEHAREAERGAEAAFFEKSMVGQVYFPDEHKVAVYLPLLGPIGVPLVTSAAREITRWRRMRKGGVPAA